MELPERQYGADCRLWVPGHGVNWPVRAAAGVGGDRRQQRGLGASTACRQRASACVVLSEPRACLWRAHAASRARRRTCQVISATVWDEFTLAHALGWWGKALIVRDYGLL